MKRHVVLIKSTKPDKFNYCKFGNYKDKQGRIVNLVDVNDQMTNGYEMFQAVLSLDINQKQDKRVYEFLKDHPLLTGKFRIEDLKANEQKNAEGALKSAEAITKATHLTINAMKDLAILMGIDSDIEDTMLKAKIIQFANGSPDEFIALTNDIDQEYRIFLKKALAKNVLTKVNGVWKHGSVNIGLADEQAIVWLKDNADLYALLRRQLRTGKVAVEETPIIEEAHQPQTMSSSTINQLENESTKAKGWFSGTKNK
mgnify:CR=1 FL=1|tara:strand:+ start:137 stop:904 length:768 start_codon:yes stop_codon:yes gene_type:complete